MAKHTYKSCTGAHDHAPLTHRLIEQLWTLGPAFTRWAESHMTAPGMTPQRLRLLALLKHGPVMMSSLKGEMGVAATTITALVDALEKDKLVVRKAHATDRRATLIALTSKAEKYFSEDCAVLKERMAELFTSFSKAQQEQFLGHLLHMRDALIERHVLESPEPAAKLGKKRGAA